MSFGTSGSPRSVAFLALCCCALVFSNFAFAGDPQAQRRRAGEFEPIDIVMGYSTDTFHEQLVWHPDASFIMVHFRNLDLAPGVELTVSDHEELTVHTYPGAGFTTDETSGKWLLGVPGDTAVLKLRVVDPDGSVDLSASGVVIDRMLWGYPPGGVGQPEGHCGADDHRDIECYTATHPTEVERSAAVAQLLVGGFQCTAWRVGAGPYMMANNHCIASQADLNNASFWFNRERTGCGTGTGKPVTVITGDTLLETNYALDFTLFTIDNPGQAAQFGYLELDPRTPVLGEEIYIPGHPGDHQPFKQFALESDFNTGGLCVIDDVFYPGRTGQPFNTGYYCDSIGGQSGSPVLARSSHKVLALHNLGTTVACGGINMNSGVRIEMIWPIVESYLGPMFEDGFESGDTSEWSTTVP